MSFTNADNIYGSDVVRRVRRASLSKKAAKGENNSKMLLVAMDSRNFVYQGNQLM